MIFYERATLAGLLIASLPAIVSLYFYFIRDKKSLALWLLLLSALFLRVLMISLDPFVHEWDERYHALVAKNMITSPFKPMLFTKHIMAFNPEDWAYGHIWVHKQPLFLWQMAMSMKLFGINVIAMRLPSMIMGTIMVWLVYDIARKWIGKDSVAFTAAFLAAFAYYPLELIAGGMSLEHNDLAFTFYMTCSIWAFTRYIHSGFKLSWACWIGVFAGLAILNKWLTGLLIFGGWGLYLLLSEERLNKNRYIHLLLAAVICTVIFLPWQLYILKAFPAESAIAFEYNRKHMKEDLGHPGNYWFHFRFLPIAYHIVLLILLIPGLISLFKRGLGDRKMTLAFLSMIAVIFIFFSLFVATKMPAFVYPVSSLMLIIMALGLVTTGTFLSKGLNPLPIYRCGLMFLLVMGVGFLALKPEMILKHRNSDNAARNHKIHRAQVFRNLDERITKDYVILNCRAYENIELMFYKDALAYHWYPTAEVLDSLQAAGYKFAAFQYKEEQFLPEYILGDKEIVILDDFLR